MTETNLFGEILINRKIAQALAEMGFEEPTPIQAKVIPVIMEGRDVIGQAQTGTGKTAAFGIPIIERINTRLFKPQGLIIAPTRELAIQVAEELSKIGRHRGVKCLPVYGGQEIERQMAALRGGVHLVIGTPGRLLDHLRRGTLRLDRVGTVILDEADEMLDMGFIEDIEQILKQTPYQRQTLLFSATMPGPIRDLSNKYMTDPEFISVSRDTLTVPQTEQFYYETRENTKLDTLCRLLDGGEVERAIVFCRTKRGVDELVASLTARGFLADGLHGDLTQTQRDRVMKKVKMGKIDLLVASDVAARGLDIENISHVINYDIPQDPESYVHRIGRTGRAGKSGKAITLVTSREFRQLKLIEQVVKQRIKRGELPSPADLAERQQEQLAQKIRLTLENGQLTLYRRLMTSLADEYDTIDLAAAALCLAVEGVPVPERRKDDEIDLSNTGARPGMVRLFLNIGRLQNIRSHDIVKTIAEEAGIPGNIIGLINIYDKFTFVEVPEDVAARVIGCVQKSLINGKRVNIEPARGRTSGR